jgi:hypothetical protein
MRRGGYQSKKEPQLEGYGRHRVIIPVYIPSLDDYFARFVEILKFCIDSLYITTAGKAKITIISNNSVREVVEELQSYHQDGYIDQLLLNRTNRGKVDAVVSVARGCFEDLITISDCDVLFKQGWLETVEEIFAHFPECGSVSPVPDPRFSWHYTSATILGGLATRELAVEKVIPDEDLDLFGQSIGWDMYTPEHRRAQMIVRRNGTTACVGSGHFVFTMRKEVLEAMPTQASLMAISGKSEEMWLDMPPDRRGFWRLATTRSYAYHMGNIPESWMCRELEVCRSVRLKTYKRPDDLPPVQRPLISKLPWRLRCGLVRYVKKCRPLLQMLENSTANQSLARNIK